MAPNHHADQDHFSGLGGLLAGLSMTVGRGGSSRLAAQLSRGPAPTTTSSTWAAARDPRRATRPGWAPGSRASTRLPVMLRLARRLTPSSDPVTYVEGAAEALPLADGSATVLWSLASVHHWADIARSLREVGRVLAPGGRFVAIEKEARPGATGHASHGWTDEQAATFADACTAAGVRGRADRARPRARPGPRGGGGGGPSR